LANPQLNKVVRTPGAWFEARAPHHHVEVVSFMELIPAGEESLISETIEHVINRAAEL
jgi:hypothetical protein